MLPENLLAEPVVVKNFDLGTVTVDEAYAVIISIFGLKVLEK